MGRVRRAETGGTAGLRGSPRLHSTDVGRLPRGAGPGPRGRAPKGPQARRVLAARSDEAAQCGPGRRAPLNLGAEKPPWAGGGRGGDEGRDLGASATPPLLGTARGEPQARPRSGSARPRPQQRGAQQPKGRNGPRARPPVRERTDARDASTQRASLSLAEGHAPAPTAARIERKGLALSEPRRPQRGGSRRGPMGGPGGVGVSGTQRLV